MAVFTESNKSTFLALFHAARKSDVEYRSLSTIDDFGQEKANTINASTLIKYGICFVDEEGKLISEVSADLGNKAILQFGLNNGEWSNSFHKDWDVVANDPIEVLVLDQLIHYVSTYGLEKLGFKAMPIIPREAVLSDPDALPHIRTFTIIQTVTDDHALEMIKDYLQATVSPNKTMVEEIIDLMQVTDVQPDDITSFELKVARCEQLNKPPVDGQDFLRFLIYVVTGSTLLIKDKETIAKLKSWCQYRDIHDYLVQADEIELAKIFYRYKPLFLALKPAKDCAPIINRIRRLAVKYHEPVSGMTISNLMGLLAQNREEDALKVIEKASNRALIKAMNYASSELEYDGIHIYNIRNGKMFVTDADQKDNMYFNRSKALDKIFYECYRQLRYNCMNKLDHKIFIIPDYINYTVPISEKQVIGNIPYGTFVHAPVKHPKLTAAIYWENGTHGRVDLDLHMSNATQQFGWNSSYRSEDKKQVLYSGDMTDATDGAVEAFRFCPDEEETYFLTVNNFTGIHDLPFKFFMSTEEFTPQSCRKEPVIEIENALFTPIPVKFNDNNALTLGYFVGDKFVFYGGELGSNIIPVKGQYAGALEAIKHRTQKMVRLNAYINMCGGIVVNSQEAADEFLASNGVESVGTSYEVIDLTPSALTARTLFDLID